MVVNNEKVRSQLLGKVETKRKHTASVVSTCNVTKLVSLQHVSQMNQQIVLLSPLLSFLQAPSLMVQT